MNGIARMSEAAVLGLHAMGSLAGEESRGSRLSAGALARKLRASEAHLAKVLQRLERAGLVLSQRGPRGGFRLARQARRIPLLEIYEALDGRIRTEACLFARPICGRKHGDCVLGGLATRLNRELRSTLSRTTVADVEGPGKGGAPCPSAR